mgnify:CR=1 FL=1
MVCLVICRPAVASRAAGRTGEEMVMRGGGTVKSIRPPPPAVHSSAGFGLKLGLELVVDMGEHCPDDDGEQEEENDIDDEEAAVESEEEGGGGREEEGVGGGCWWCNEDGCEEEEEEGGGHQLPLLEIKGS